MRIQEEIVVTDSSINTIAKLTLYNFPELPTLTNDPEDVWFSLRKENKDSFNEMINKALNNTYDIGVTEDINGESYGTIISIPLSYPYFVPQDWNFIGPWPAVNNGEIKGPYYETFTLSLDVDTKDGNVTSVGVIFASSAFINGTQAMFVTDITFDNDGNATMVDGYTGWLSSTISSVF